MGGSVRIKAGDSNAGAFPRPASTRVCPRVGYGEILRAPDPPMTRVASRSSSRSAAHAVRSAAAIGLAAIALSAAACAGRAGPTTDRSPRIDARPIAPVEEALDAGPMLGALTSSGARIWVRIDPSRIDPARPTALRLELVGATDAASRAFEAEASAEGDGTAVFRLEGLRPGHLHRYRIARVDGGQTLAEGSFSTTPVRMARARIAFGSGAEVDEATDATFRAIEREHPDAFVLLGDAPSIGTTNLATQRARYRALAKSPAFAGLVAETPLYATWSDDDFGAADADGRLAGKSNSRRAFTEYRPNPSFGDGVEGVYTSFAIGSAEVFLLDTRWFAGSDAASGARAAQPDLGETQWRWLEAALARSTAPFKIVATGSAWSGAREVQRLAESVGRARASGVVLVSGDGARSRVIRHATSALAGYDLVEFVTSPMHGAAASDAAHVEPRVLFDCGAAQVFLVIDIEEARADGPALRGVFVGAQGGVIHTHEAEIASLAPAG